MSTDSLNLESILNTVEAIQDPSEKSDFLFKKLAIVDDPKKVEDVKKSATKKDLQRLVGILQDKKRSGIVRQWAAQMLATIGSKKETKIIEQALFSPEYSQIRGMVFASLLSKMSTFPIAPRLKLIFRLLKEETITVDKSYLESIEQSIKENGLTREFLEELAKVTRFEQEERVATLENAMIGLRILASIENYKKEFSKYRTDLIKILKENFDLDFNQANIQYDISVNAAKILDSLKLTKDIVDAIWSNVVGSSRGVYLAGKYGDQEFALVLARELRDQGGYFEGDPFWISYREILIQALGEIGKRIRQTKKLDELEEKLKESLEEAIEVLTKMLCNNLNKEESRQDEKLNTILLRTIEMIKGESETAAYIVLRIMEAKDIHQCGYLKMLVLLKDKQTAFARLEDHFHKGKPDERIKAEEAIKELGLSEAVDLLITKQVDRIFSDYIANPMKEVEKKSIEILGKTVDQITRTCNVNTIMSIIIFAAGVGVIVLGAVLAITSTDPTQLAVGGGGVAGGIATSMVTFLKGPVNTVQRATADLAQVETAFLYNIRSMGLASFAFLTEYLKQEKPNIQVLNDCGSMMRNSAKNTMLLIELFGSANKAFEEYVKAKKDVIIETIIDETKTAKLLTPTENDEANNQSTPTEKGKTNNQSTPTEKGKTNNQ